MVVLCHGSDYFLAGLKSVDISNKNQLSGVLIFYRYCKRITDKPQVQIAANISGVDSTENNVICV